MIQVVKGLLKMNFELQGILEYCDGPQIITVSDSQENIYLGVYIGYSIPTDSRPTETFICVKVSEGRLSEFTTGKICLRSCFTNSEDGIFYKLGADGKTIEGKKISFEDILERQLSSEGYFYEGQNS